MQSIFGKNMIIESNIKETQQKIKIKLKQKGTHLYTRVPHDSVAPLVLLTQLPNESDESEDEMEMEFEESTLPDHGASIFDARCQQT